MILFSYIVDCLLLVYFAFISLSYSLFIFFHRLIGWLIYFLFAAL